ncbi:MAG TPA: hypothetical protein VGJ30_01515 [Candidatus Angelobacter sp.]|jgi:hypothetical protein
MSRALKILIVAIFAMPAVACAVQADNNYSIEEVKALLSQPPGFSSSFSEKQAGRLGDRVSIALMKIYQEDELIKPDNVKRYLPVIGDAFRNPSLISAEDRTPRVTIVLLKFLMAQVHDRRLKDAIAQTERAIRDKTAPANPIK